MLYIYEPLLLEPKEGRFDLLWIIRVWALAGGLGVCGLGF